MVRSRYNFLQTTRQGDEKTWCVGDYVCSYLRGYHRFTQKTNDFFHCSTFNGHLPVYLNWCYVTQKTCSCFTGTSRLRLQEANDEDNTTRELHYLINALPSSKGVLIECANSMLSVTSVIVQDKQSNKETKVCRSRTHSAIRVTNILT